MPARSLGLVDALDHALYRLERGVTRNAGVALRVAAAGGGLAALAQAGRMLWTGIPAAFAAGQVLQPRFFDPTGHIMAVLSVGWSLGLTLLAGLILATTAVLCLGYASRAEIPGMEDRHPGRVRVYGCWDRPLTLHRRPGQALYLNLTWDPLPPGTQVEMALRLRRAGRYLPACLRGFRGRDGELLVRQLTADLPADSAYLEAGVFVPLRALELPDGVASLKVTAEVQLRIDGHLESLLEHPLELDLSHRAEAPEAVTTTEIELEAMATALVAAEAVCQVCGDGLDGALVHCGACETPAHAECWDFVGHCSTFACEGQPREGAAPQPAPADEAATPPADPAAALQVVSPRASLRRITDHLPTLGVDAGWELRCPSCKVDRVTVEEGLCPDCGQQLVASTRALMVPRQPPRLVETPLGATATAALIVLAPLLGLVGLVAAAPAVLFPLLGAAAVAASLDPRGLGRFLLRPATRAGELLQRAFPPPGVRNFTPRVRLIGVEGSQGLLLEGGGVDLRIKLVSRGIRDKQLEVVFRLRGPDGRYLAARHPADAGVFGELQARHLLPAPEDAAARCHLVRVTLRADAAVVPEGARGAELVGEVLVGYEGLVLAEGDFPVPWSPPSQEFVADAGEPAVGTDDRIWQPGEDLGDQVGTKLCPLCGDELLKLASFCLNCRQRSHPACNEFLGRCASCGSTKVEVR